MYVFFLSFVKGKKPQIVSDLKYLGIITDSQLTFEKQVKRIVCSVKLNLSNFKFIRKQLSTDGAKLYMHSVIFPCLSYCITWSQAGKNIVRPMNSLYKTTFKIVDKKPTRYHHCHIITKYNLWTFDNFVYLANSCLMCKITHDLAPPTLTVCFTMCK